MSKTTSVSMRDLAEIAGVSVMTVSRALKNNPKISEGTRASIQKLAKEKGYRVNPLVSAQMASIKARKLSKYQATIGLILNTPDEGVWVGVKRVINGVKKACDDMDFAYDVFDLANEELSPRTLERILRSRGILALIETPASKDLSHYGLDFSNLIVVSSNPGRLPQTFHRVTPDHYGNMDMLLRHLADAGFRRLGLMIPQEVDTRINYLWSSRFLAFQQREKLGNVPPFMPENTSSFEVEPFRKWFDRYHPDVLIVSSQELFQTDFFESAGIEIPGDVEVVKVNINDLSRGFSGVDMMSEEVGAECVRLTSQLLYQNEFGVPKNPISVLLPGRMVEGNMCPSLTQ